MLCPVNLALKGLLFSPISSITCSVSCIERVLFHLGGLGTFFCGVGEVMLFLIQKLHVAKLALMNSRAFYFYLLVLELLFAKTPGYTECSFVSTFFSL